MSQIRKRDVLQSVLLQVLSKFPQGLHIHEAYDEIEKNFTFPEGWYREIPGAAGYHELEARGIHDWRKVPQEQLIQMVSTEPQWQNEIRWARNDLRKAGHLDTNVPRGIWKLKTSSRNAIDATLQKLTSEEKKIATPKERKRTSLTAESAISSRTALEKKLSLLISSMPIEDLELLVDIARAIRLRSIEK